MSLRRAKLERQLKNAQDSVAEYSKVLDEQKIATDKRKKHPKWRKLNAQRIQIVNRLISLKVMEDREESFRQKAAAAAAEG
ncbi:MAG: hypothetical protein QM501_14895 [Gimesia sp.]